MSLRTAKCAVDEEDDWEIISTTDWWHTPVNAARWSFVPTQHAVESLAPRQQFRGSLFYETLSVASSSRSSSKERRNTDDVDTLNVELDGVKSSLEALSVYERDVGFHLDIQISPPVPQDVIDLTAEVDENDFLVRKKRWDELLEGLMNGPAFDNHADSDDSLESSFIGEDLLRSTSTISSIGTSFSEGSVDSVGMPSTPKPKSSFNDVEIKDLSPTGSVNGSVDYSFSPRRSLNASASSFVPTFSPQTKDEPLQFPSLDPSSPLTSFANFTFPTLNSPPEIKKDDQISQPATQSAGLLPPFLQEPPSQRNRYRKSRTREIVDRLRSQGSPLDLVAPKFASHSPSPINDLSNVVTPRLSVSEDGSRLSTPSVEEDAWIDLTPPTVASSSSPLQKARRTRELFLALTRRRTDSLSSENVKDMMMAPEGSAISSQPPSQNVSSESSPLPRSPPSLATSTEGWIEAFAPLEPPRQSKQPSNSSRDSSQHSRKKSSNHASRASMSSSNSHPQHSHHLHSHGVSSSSASSSISQHHPHHQHQYRHHHHASSPSTFSATSPYLPHHTPHHSMFSAPAPTTMPYFFPAYPGVAMPVPFTAFMHMPNAAAAYRIPGSVPPMHAAPHPPVYGAAQQPSLMRGSMVPPPTTKQSLNSTTPSSTTPMIMNMTPDIYKGKHSPLW